MKMKKYVLFAVVSVFACCAFAGQINKEAKQFKYSTTIEKERPQLNEATKKLIAAYRKNPTKENYNALKKQVELNYDAVIARKQAKLQELKKTAKHASKIAEMEEIVNDVIKDRQNRIEQSMRRFTDPRLRPNARSVSGGFLPVLGAAQNVNIAYTPVTNAQFAEFVKATNAKAPKDWQNGAVASGKENLPVVNVSYETAVKYCIWLSEKDKGATYRLPTETEWEYAAGHMPKDADFNCGVQKSLSNVFAYSKTLSASGAIDMWGNCWEMTSTCVSKNGKTQIKVKGGAFDSPRMSCRTEYRDETRDANSAYGNVGFRVVRQTK